MSGDFARLARCCQRRQSRRKGISEERTMKKGKRELPGLRRRQFPSMNARSHAADGCVFGDRESFYRWLEVRWKSSESERAKDERKESERSQKVRKCYVRADSHHSHTLQKKHKTRLKKQEFRGNRSTQAIQVWQYTIVYKYQISTYHICMFEFLETCTCEGTRSKNWPAQS